MKSESKKNKVILCITIYYVSKLDQILQVMPVQNRQDP